MRLWRRTVAFLLMSVGYVALAQEALPQFEVASIKLNPNPLARPFNLPLPGGRIDYRGDSLKDLIVIAWRIDPDNIIGGPGWLSSTRYNISAKAASDSTDALSAAQLIQSIPLMMRSLVIDRFQVTAHFETRERPVFALVVAQKNGRLGPAIQEPHASRCQPLDLSAAPAAFALGKAPPLTCGMGFMVTGGRLRGAGVDMGQLAQFLSRFVVGGTVIDKTGLTRKFDIDMEWSASLARPDSVADSNEPSLFTVLQERLGLKLESQKGPVQVLVIDHVEEPSAN